MRSSKTWSVGKGVNHNTHRQLASWYFLRALIWASRWKKSTWELSLIDWWELNWRHSKLREKFRNSLSWMIAKNRWSANQLINGIQKYIIKKYGIAWQNTSLKRIPQLFIIVLSNSLSIPKIVSFWASQSKRNSEKLILKRKLGTKVKLRKKNRARPKNKRQRTILIPQKSKPSINYDVKAQINVMLF